METGRKKSKGWNFRRREEKKDEKIRKTRVKRKKERIEQNLSTRVDNCLRLTNMETKHENMKHKNKNNITPNNSHKQQTPPKNNNRQLVKQTDRVK